MLGHYVFFCVNWLCYTSLLSFIYFNNLNCVWYFNVSYCQVIYLFQQAFRRTQSRLFIYLIQSLKKSYYKQMSFEEKSNFFSCFFISARRRTRRWTLWIWSSHWGRNSNSKIFKVCCRQFTQVFSYCLIPGYYCTDEYHTKVFVLKYFKESFEAGKYK